VSGKRLDPTSLLWEHPAMELIGPDAAHLGGFVDALERGWSPDTQRPEAAGELLAEIATDPQGFLERTEDRDPRGRTVTLADGSTAPRLPGLSRWMWDGEFSGSINLRWQPGTVDLPPHCLGHIGYAVVPWKRRRGYATDALRQMLDVARAEGLPAVVITTDHDNLASQRVVEANGAGPGEAVERHATSGGGTLLRYRIDL
jgi:predicted acetyltransferase